MKSIFEQETYTDTVRRVESLTTGTKALWGKMNASQMLAHCNEPIEGLIGKKIQPKEGNFLIRLFFKKLLYNDKPYKQNLPTAKSFIMPDTKNFNFEKARLIQNIKDAHAKGMGGSWVPHPAFGQYTPEQNGMVVFKHLDHHLKQFGV
jgi:hypothetical protein